jgi:hypothetical protein
MKNRLKEGRYNKNWSMKELLCFSYCSAYCADLLNRHNSRHGEMSVLSYHATDGRMIAIREKPPFSSIHLQEPQSGGMYSWNSIAIPISRYPFVHFASLLMNLAVNMDLLDISHLQSWLFRPASLALSALLLDNKTSEWCSLQENVKNLLYKRVC